MLLSGWWRRFSRTMALLVRVVTPAYLAVVLLEASGWLEALTGWVGGPLRWIGIGPEGVLPLLIGVSAALYAAIGSMASLGLSPEQALPVVLFLNFAHAMPMEVAVSYRCRVNPWRITAARLAMATAAALLAPVFAPLLPAASPAASASGAVAAAGGTAGPAGLVARAILWKGVLGLGRLLLTLVAVLAPATLCMEVLERRGLLDRWSDRARPYVRRFGLSGEAAFPILTGLFLGLVYGAGLLMDRMERGRLSEQEAWRVFLFLGACHSVLEDPFIFAAVGVGPHILLPLRLAAGAAVLAGLAAASVRRGAPSGPAGRHPQPVTAPPGCR